MRPPSRELSLQRVQELHATLDRKVVPWSCRQRSLLAHAAPAKAEEAQLEEDRLHEREGQLGSPSRVSPGRWTGVSSQEAPQIFTTTRYASTFQGTHASVRAGLWRPCSFCHREVPFFEVRQHAKECGRRWMRRKHAYERRLLSAPRFPCGSCDKTFARSHLRSQHVRNRECQPSTAQARNSVAVQAAPSQLVVARTSTRQTHSVDGALALVPLSWMPWKGDPL